MIIMWIGGNDVYPRFLGVEPTTRVGGGSEPAAAIWAELDEAVRWAAGAESVFIVGPTHTVSIWVQKWPKLNYS